MRCGVGNTTDPQLAAAATLMFSLVWGRHCCSRGPARRSSLHRGGRSAVEPRLSSREHVVTLYKVTHTWEHTG